MNFTTAFVNATAYIAEHDGNVTQENVDKLAEMLTELEELDNDGLQASFFDVTQIEDHLETWQNELPSEDA